MWFALTTIFACSGDPAPTPDGMGTPPGTTPATPTASTSDSSASTPTADTADTGTEAPCAPAEVAVGSVPAAATVTLEPDLCRCVLVGVGQGLPGLVLTYNEGVAYGQADAVDGWRLTDVQGDPMATLFPGGETAAGLAYDAAYRYRMSHPATGVEAEVTARITNDRRVALDVHTWLAGCP